MINPNLFKTDMHSLQLLEELAQKVEGESVYQRDGDVDDWSFNQQDVIKAVTTEGEIIIADDCDWQRALLWVLLDLGWNPACLAECCVDSTPSDKDAFDHYIALAWVPDEGDWFGFNCWAYGEVVSLPDIVHGEYTNNDGNYAHPVRVDRHRLLSDFTDGRPQWYQGLPPQPKDSHNEVNNHA